MVTSRLVLLLGLAAACGRPAGDAADTAVKPAQAPTTYRVVVNEHYGKAKITLPYARVLSAFLEPAGLHEAAEGVNPDVIIRVKADGDPLERDYNQVYQGSTAHAFSGAEISGECIVARGGKEERAFAFTGAWSPPDVIKEKFADPDDATFIEPFGEFVFRAADWVGRTYGAKPLTAVLRKDPLDSLFIDVPQIEIAAAEALAKYGGSDAIPVLRDRLGNGGGPERAAAARGLRIARDHDSLPQLVACFNDDDGLLKNDDVSARWDRLIDLDLAVEPMDDANGVYDSGVEILAAVASVYRTSDRAVLLEALRDQSSAVRRIDAAIVFGRARDKGAAEALIAALKDNEILVRAAAANALGAIGDSRAVPALKAIKDNDGVDGTAADNALDKLHSETAAPAH